MKMSSLTWNFQTSNLSSGQKPSLLGSTKKGLQRLVSCNTYFFPGRVVMFTHLAFDRRVSFRVTAFQMLDYFFPVGTLLNPSGRNSKVLLPGDSHCGPGPKSMLFLLNVCSKT